MRVIFMGTPDFAVATLEAVIEAGHEVVLVVSQPDKPVGRHGELKPTPVKECALSHGLNIYQPDRIKKQESIDYLAGYECDVIVVVAFGQIIPKAILDMPHNCCVNVHASLLPRYRGAAPIQWTIINGDETAGVTTQRMDEGLDTGDIIMTEEVKLSGEETGGSLFDILSEIGARLCVRTLSAIADGTATYTPQDKSHASHTSKITKEMGDIDWSFTAVEIERRIRGCSPWPGTYTHIGDKTLKIWRARVADDDTAGAILQSMTAEPGGTAKHMAREDVTGAHEIPCGTVVSSQKGVIAVACGEGVLLLDELQLQGKKRMDASSFLNGYKIEPGTRLIRLAE